ncbi:MAG: colanic acid biosynthesis glycosyltransferase WcaL, partial [Akkermansiaceae bacterium]|nr:colanic acid biosynthesis glycosyltransferase WcaL [Akkermansiaceae bacterium]
MTEEPQPPHDRKTVAYILRKFPVLSETFILNEILALEARGIPVHIFSLERPNDPRFHENLPRLKASISYIPDLSEASDLEKYRPRVARRYGDGFKTAETYAERHESPSLAHRLLQSCYVADQVRRYRIGHFHAHFATRATTVAFFASMVTGLPYSFTAHAMDIFKTHLSSRALARKMEHARFVVTISDYNRRLLEEI